MSRRIVLALAALAAALVVAPGGQTASTELFFSEYIEGSSNNKALEIFNGTGAGDQRAVSTSGADRTGVRLLFAAVIDDPLCFFQNGLLRCFKTRELAPDAKGP